jgi:hypothetical protein
MRHRWAGRRAGRRGALGLAASLALLAACERPPVAWEESRRASAAGAAAATAAAAVAVTAAGELAPAEEPADVAVPATSAAHACAPSVRLARRAGAAGPAATYAVWWAVRPDSSALLLAARSDDGGRTWVRTLAVDTLDRSGRGCARPAPAATVDAVNGYVHVAYFMEAPEGAGVFYSHLMDPRAQFEPGAVVIYGDRPAAASVASHGDTVAVAYENPNGDRPRVELALSYTGGHLFAHRGVAVSSENAAAEAPGVALAGRRVAVAWLERHATADVDTADAADAASLSVVVRRGELQ